MPKVFASVDVSSSKIVCLIAQKGSDGRLCIKGASLHEALGIKNGNVINPKLATQSIVKAVSRAEKIYGKNIENISVGVSGDLLKSKILKTKLNFESRRVITKSDMLSMSREITEELNREEKSAVHIVPIEFAVDGVSTSNPLGISGKNLEAKFNVFFTKSSKMENLSNCFRKINLVVDNIVFEGLASALAVLNGSEMENGALVVDIGAGTTSFAVIRGNRFEFGASLPIGGDNITGDLANILDVSFAIAERIKIVNTNMFLDKLEENELIKVDIEDDESFRVAGNKKKIVNDIFRSRVQEIINLVLGIIDRKGLFSEFGEMVVTGGIANVPGLDNFIARTTNIRTRIGVPENFSVSSAINHSEIKKPTYATSIGILNFIDYIGGKEEVIAPRGIAAVAERVIGFLTNLFTS
ncbi:MAG: cell division protein FtsA [Rickettsiales bacterium]|jgi:cell division protein FtsA|nr:cell division protein FtsA [Rickettsiales bacterium]